MSKRLSPTARLTYAAVLTALCVVCNCFTVTFPGSPQALSFNYVPTFLAGIILGPFWGLAVGLLGDVLGAIVHPLGPYLPLIGLASALMGGIPGAVFRWVKGNDYVKLTLSLLLVFVICSAGLNTYALYAAYAASGGKTFWVYLSARLPMQSLVLVINAAILFALRASRLLERLRLIPAQAKPRDPESKEGAPSDAPSDLPKT